MMNSNRIAALLLTILAVCLVAPALAEPAGELTACSALDEITVHGNVALVKDGRILLQDLEDAGIECGDTVRVHFLDQALDMPVARDFSEVAVGGPLMRVKDDAVQLALNMDEFATKYIADKTVAADGTTTWSYKAGIEGPVAFRIERLEKGGEGSVQLRYTDERSDYPNLSDEEFANFRAVATTGMGQGALYRTASPVNPMHGRSAIADAALKRAGVLTVLNLADTPESLAGYEGFAETYYATTDYITLAMAMSFDNDAFRDRLAEGLRFFGAHEGPYAVHCLEGKDRTGVVAALLECFMGASWEEVLADYMVSFYNYYGIKPGDAAYDTIAGNNIAMTLRTLFHTDDLENADLGRAAEDYFREIGLDDGEIERLRANLGKSYSDGAVAAEAA